MRHRGSVTGSYGFAMREDASPEGAAFATLLRESRAERGLLQEDVIRATSISRSTYLRWEAGGIDRPDPRQVREVCLVLGINPRRSAVALGLVTNDELGLPPDEPKYHPAVVQIGRILADPSVPEPARDALLHTLHAALNLWQMTVSMPVPHEPSGDALTKRRAKTR